MCISIYSPIDDDKKSPESLQIAVIVNAMKKAGIEINLYNFVQNPSLYTDNQAVEKVLMQDGPDAFPVTVVDGEIFQKNRYPHYDELMKWSTGADISELTD